MKTFKKFLPETIGLVAITLFAQANHWWPMPVFYVPAIGIALVTLFSALAKFVGV